MEAFRQFNESTCPHMCTDQKTSVTELADSKRDRSSVYDMVFKPSMFEEEEKPSLSSKMFKTIKIKASEEYATNQELKTERDWLSDRVRGLVKQVARLVTQKEEVEQEKERITSKALSSIKQITWLVNQRKELEQENKDLQKKLLVSRELSKQLKHILDNYAGPINRMEQIKDFATTTMKDYEDK